MRGKVFTLMALIGIIGTNGLVLSPVLTDIARDFGVSVAVAGRAITAFGVGTAVSALWLGASLERFGTARALMLAMVVGGVGQLIAALASGWVWLTAAQGLVGLAAGVGLPAIYALTADISPAGQEARILGRVILGWSISLIAAIPLGAFLADVLGWRVMLGLIGTIGIATLPFTARFRNRHITAQDAEPMGRFAPLFIPGGLTAYLVCFLFMGVFYGTYTYTGAHAIRDFGISTGRAGLIALFYGIGFGAASLMAGMIDRIGTARMRLIGFPAAAIALIGMGMAPSYGVYLVAIAAWGWLNNQLLNTIVTGLTALAPRSKGAVLGLYSGITYIAAAAGTFTMGQIFEGAGFGRVTLLAALLNGASLLILLATRRQATQRRS